MKIGLKWGGYVFLTSVCFWLFLTDYIAKDIEQQLNVFLVQQHKQSAGLLRLQLVDYEKSVLHAKATMVIHSDNRAIENILGGSVLQSRIEYGPVMVDQANKSLIFAYSRSITTLDRERLNKRAAFLITHLFKSQTPILAHTKTDFDAVLHYDVNIAPIHYELLRTSVSLSAGKIQGRYMSSSSYLPLITYKMGDMVMENGIGERVAAGNALHFLLHNQPDVVHDVPISKIPAISLYQAALQRLSQTLQSSISAYPDPIHKKSPILNDVTASQLDVLMRVFSLYEELKNLDKQMTWTLEEAAETQEGQEHLYHLLRHFEQKALIVTSLIDERLLNASVSEEVFIFDSQTLF